MKSILVPFLVSYLSAHRKLCLKILLAVVKLNPLEFSNFHLAFLDLLLVEIHIEWKFGFEVVNLIST